MEKKFNIGLAFLRIWMCFEVVIDHFKDWNGIQVMDLNQPFRVLFQFGGIAVPVFMLMSFTLSNIEEIITSDNSKIKHRMYRLLIPQLFWTLVYFFIYWLIDLRKNLDLIKDFSDFWWQLFLGHSINQTTWYQIDLIMLTVIFVIAYKILKIKNGIYFTLYWHCIYNILELMVKCFKI